MFLYQQRMVSVWIPRVDGLKQHLKTFEISIKNKIWRLPYAARHRRQCWCRPGTQSNIVLASLQNHQKILMFIIEEDDDEEEDGERSQKYWYVGHPQSVLPTSRLSAHPFSWTELFELNWRNHPDPPKRHQQRHPDQGGSISGPPSCQTEEGQMVRHAKMEARKTNEVSWMVVSY